MSLYDRIFLCESDEETRRLERDYASSGDETARDRLIAARLRSRTMPQIGAGRKLRAKGGITAAATRATNVAGREGHDACTLCDRPLTRGKVHWGSINPHYGSVSPYCSRDCRIQDGADPHESPRGA